MSSHQSLVKVLEQLDCLQRKLPTSRILPRIYYLLEPVLNEDADKESLISMYKSLTKRDVGCDPLLYIIWALKQMTYEHLAVEHLLNVLPQPFSPFWMPSNPRIVMRMIIVNMDMSEHFRNDFTFKKFVSFIMKVDQRIGNPKNYPSDNYKLRMELYRRLEDLNVISPRYMANLTSTLKSMSLDSLKDKVERDIYFYLTDKEVKLNEKLQFVENALPKFQVLPRIYYMLQPILTGEADKESLISMYNSLEKRQLNGVHPLLYIMWAIRHTSYELLTDNHLQPFLPFTFPEDWMPDNLQVVMRMIIVEMDMSQQLSDSKTYKKFVEFVVTLDDLIGHSDNYPPDDYECRMDLYRTLEELKIIGPDHVINLAEALKMSHLYKLKEKIEQDFRSLLFSHRCQTPSSYYMYYQLAIPKRQSSVSTTSTSLTSTSYTTSTSKQISTVPPQCSTVTPYQYVTPVTFIDGSLKESISNLEPPQPPAPILPPIETRIWTDGEAGPDIVHACIEKLQACCIFPDDKKFMRRVAYVMSRDGDPPFPLLTDGGIWQVSLHGFLDTMNTKSHAHLTTKYEEILLNFRVDWKKVERRFLAKPMYSAIAAQLYISNFAEPIPPEHHHERQANYWWDMYMKNSESRRLMKRDDFVIGIKELSLL